ncbi:TPA: ferric reductase-like transmembrane domain-containing protein [Streptococcus agalactiae]
MRAWKGIVLILSSIVVTLVAWQNAGLSEFVVPGLALTSLSLTFLLSTKFRILESYFQGIENMYFYHKVMAVFSMILLLLHKIGLGQGGHGSEFAKTIGSAGLYLFLSIVFVAYFGNFLKYEIWRFIHRFVYLVYILGLVHTFLILGDRILGNTLLSLIVLGYAVIGVISGFYIIFLYSRMRFRRVGYVQKVTHLNHDTTEIEIAMKRPYRYDYGQFTFLKIYQAGFESAAHPFSISGGHDRVIFLTVKASGDYTKSIYKQLKVGTKIALDRAYGHMLFDKDKKEQVWIAGGIGITPFISFIRENSILTKRVDFFYTFSNQDNLIYQDMLESYAKANPNFKLHLNNSSLQGRLDFNQSVFEGQPTIFMCGPTSMTSTYAKVFRQKDAKSRLVYEGFSFRDSWLSIFLLKTFDKVYSNLIK